MTFNDAAKRVQEMNAYKPFGHNDWRIPDINQLRIMQKNQDKGTLKDTFTKEEGKYPPRLARVLLVIHGGSCRR